MPGIFGICSLHDDPSLFPVVNSMRSSLTHRTSFVSDVPFRDEKVCAGRCRVGIVETPPQPIAVDELFVWLDGEFYNRAEFPIKKSGGDDALLLAENYRLDPTLDFLKSVDGFFSAAIYDRPRKKVTLCTDRHGLRHLYWLKTKNYLAWASEYKAFLALPVFSPVIDRDSLQSFLQYGYIRGNRTWFNGVSLLPPATIMSYDASAGEASTSRYWSWADLKTTETAVDIGEIAEEWARRFSKAVAIRSDPCGKTGVALSGGLDSRAILAAAPERKDAVVAFTYGENGCDDMRVAPRAAAVKGAPHLMYEIDTPLWLRANLAAVWCTDGEVSLLDVLGSEFIDANSKKMSAVLNGMGGDPIHGGTLLDIKNDPDYPLRERYEDEDRRWIRPGFRLAESFYPVRMPFYDNALVELTMSIPEALRKGSFIYKRILLQNFPQYFHAIPWQKTGLPISFPPFAEKIALFCKRAKSKAARAAYRHGIPIQDSMHTVNKRRRTVAEPGRTFLWKLFVSQNALYPDYVNKDLVLSTWKRHLRGQDATAIVNRYATFEIWLRQAFSKTLRPEPESFPLVETGSL